MTDIGLGFRDADGGMLRELTRCLDFLNDLPFFKAYKAATWAALDIGAGDSILDVACGAGFDLIEMARRHPSAAFCGTDRSGGLLAIAKTRAVAAGLGDARFVRGEAARLPFKAGAFDGVRIDRALQHIEDPEEAVAEMVRVTRPGGRIVAAEPDWGAYILFNGDRDASEKLAARWRNRSAIPLSRVNSARFCPDAGSRICAAKRMPSRPQTTSAPRRFSISSACSAGPSSRALYRPKKPSAGKSTRSPPRGRGRFSPR